MTTTTAHPARALEDERSAETHPPQTPERAPWITLACYVAALTTLTVSLNTSWRFFDEVLHIPTAYGERYIMFAVAELALIVSGAGMAANVRRTGHPGPFRLVVWGMCAVSAYMAWKMSNLEEGLGRVILGPLLGTIMLHLALGLELRTRHHRTGTLTRVGRELRERMLSRFGLADDERDALQRTRDRAAFRAAQLSLPHRWRWSREARLQRALLAANVADDPHMRDKMLIRLSVLRHAHKLTTHDQPSPWLDEPKDARSDERRTPRQRPHTRAARARTPHTDPQRAPSTAAHTSVNGSTVMRGAQEHAAHPTLPAPARTLTAVPNSAAPHNGNGQTHTQNRAQTSAQSDVADNTRRHAPARPEVDQAAIQQWLPVAETIVGDGLTKGRMRRWPEEEHPEVVATILADHAAGTRPSTIGRQHQVHHELVGKILAAAGELTG